MLTLILSLIVACSPKTEPSTPATNDTEIGIVEDSGSTLDCASGESVTAYLDTDGDGYGRAYTATEMCLPLEEGYVTQLGDCRDRYPDVYPGAPEYCNGLDNDCNGKTDDNPLDPDTFYLDADLDGWGNSEFSVTGCNLPDGYVPYGGDCDDNDAERAPANNELCDGIDNDCDELIDEGVRDEDAHVWYLDTDGDGHGSSLASGIVRSCVSPEGAKETSSDCDDSDADVYNGAPEICDGKDNDCDPSTDMDIGCADEALPLAF